MSDVVRYRTEGPVAVVTMHRPQYGNAQNSAMTYALDDALYRAADDDEVKVIVLTGEGKHFSAGHARALVDPPVAEPDEIAAAIAYLGSAEARFATGAVLRLDGGAGV